MRIRLGATYRCSLEPRHIWVVITNPSKTNGQILLVNFTSLRSGCLDDECILDASDYSHLTHKSTVAYSRAHIVDETMFLEKIAQNLFVEMETVPESTLQKIVQGAHRSGELSPNKKKLIA